MNEIPEDKLEQMREFIFQNMKLQAIKEYRNCTGLGLRESKDAIDAMVAELRASSPERFRAPTLAEKVVTAVAALGCLVIVAAVLGVVVCSLVAR